MELQLGCNLAIKATIIIIKPIRYYDCIHIFGWNWTSNNPCVPSCNVEYLSVKCVGNSPPAQVTEQVLRNWPEWTAFGYVCLLSTFRDVCTELARICKFHAWNRLLHLLNINGRRGGTRAFHKFFAGPNLIARALCTPNGRMEFCFAFKSFLGDSTNWCSAMGMGFNWPKSWRHFGP